MDSSRVRMFAAQNKFAIIFLKEKKLKKLEGKWTDYQVKNVHHTNKKSECPL